MSHELIPQSPSVCSFLSSAVPACLLIIARLPAITPPHVTTYARHGIRGKAVGRGPLKPERRLVVQYLLESQDRLRAHVRGEVDLLDVLGDMRDHPLRPQEPFPRLGVRTQLLAQDLHCLTVLVGGGFECEVSVKYVQVEQDFGMGRLLRARVDEVLEIGDGREGQKTRRLDHQDLEIRAALVEDPPCFPCVVCGLECDAEHAY